ncbi:hypothetical protein [Achromobacter xylosoxidans]|uniref:hypothetical protein n=1 Tax=Alcaligenes xylosoxydans xylosoxydans TaxID=85698 RepID=UPI000761E9A9|nr:hypothetical protein [Achromobacter xylosoxidans]KWU16275.1 hypothetical protein AS148_25255 [Achromobacter xylosoxidans]
MTNPNNAAQAALQHPIDEAIVILTEEAAALSDCHTRPIGDWTGEDEVKARYDYIQTVIAALSKLRAPVADEQQAVAYLDLGAGGYVDVGTDLTDEQLATLPKGRHMLAIIGTHGVDGYTRAALASAPVAGEAVALELRGVPETINEGDGFWRSCTGCHELNEGRDTGPYSAVLRSHLGQGCSECGGIGAIWDSTDYQAMADDMARDMGQSVSAAPQPSAEPARVLFPSHLRKMWLGGEVQVWLDQHQGVTPPAATAKGSLARYRQWKAEQDQAAAPCTCPSGDGSLRHPCPVHPQTNKGQA